MTDSNSELAQMRQTYDDREVRLAGQDRYSFANKAYLYTIQQRQRAVIAMLQRHGRLPLGDQRILELGSGTGGVLLELLQAGADARSLHGSDLLAGRVQAAHRQMPRVALSCADGQNLPYPTHSFDLLLQFTMFSSILSEGVCYTVAKEMLRVVKPDGLILWYDFWVNPMNKQTHGIDRRQIRDLFPACHFDFERITLAPPLARMTVPVSWTASQLLEKLRFLNTHYLVAIWPAG